MSKIVLIVDDDENDVFAISETLSNAGVKNPLITVSDGADVISYFAGMGRYADREKFPLPRVLLLDLKMQRMGGFSVMEWLNQQHKSVRADLLVVVLTAHGELENVRRAYQLGARSFLTKPCSVDDVRNLVRGYSTFWETEKSIELAPTEGRKSASGSPVRE